MTENLLVDLLKQGSLPTFIIVMLFVFIKTLWKDWKDQNKTANENNKEISNKLVELKICSEEQNKLLTEFLSKQDNINNNIIIAMNEMSLQINNLSLNNNRGNGGKKPLKRDFITK